MYSLNVPVPGTVGALAGDLGRELPAARIRQRGERTLVAKRLGGGDADPFHDTRARTREALTGTPAFDARVAGVDVFAEAVTGTSPVVYLAVESAGLVALHERLCEAFEPVAGIEDGEYTPHVTVARGGSVEAARRLMDRDIDPIEWTVTELEFRDARRHRAIGTVSLPA